MSRKRLFFFSETKIRHLCKLGKKKKEKKIPASCKDSKIVISSIVTHNVVCSENSLPHSLKKSLKLSPILCITMTRLSSKNQKIGKKKTLKKTKILHIYHTIWLSGQDNHDYIILQGVCILFLYLKQRKMFLLKKMEERNYFEMHFFYLYFLL